MAGLPRKNHSVVKSLIIVALTCSFFSSCMIINPLRSSEESIREDLLEETPMGTSSVEVLKFINDELDHEDEYDPVYCNHPAMDRGPRGYTVPVGKKSISILLDEYWAIFPGVPMLTHVWVKWAFDENDRLIEILVHRSNDSI